MDTITYSKKITIRYVIHQTVFFMFMAGISAFSATYLLEKGFNASQVGSILAISNLVSCIVQPLMGDVVDRLKTFVLPQITAVLFVGTFACYAVILMFEPPLMLFGFLYGAGLFLSSLTNTLNNSICAYYTNQGYFVDYGAGQGAGSLSFSFASLGLGYVMAWFGVDSMIWITLALLIAMVIIVLGYPKLSGEMKRIEKEKKEERVSILVFFGKYKLFVITMVGIMMQAVCHTMSENYFIEVFKNIGGGSEHVGIALFIGCTTAVPFFIYFDKLQDKFGINIFLRTGGFFFALKMLLLILATQVWHIYLIELLQLFTYGFIHQPLYYLAKHKVSEADLVKGQAVSVAMYGLGTAIGNFVGGRTIDLWGVRFTLCLALVIAFVGAIIINLSLGKEENRAAVQ